MEGRCRGGGDGDGELGASTTTRGIASPETLEGVSRMGKVHRDVVAGHCASGDIGLRTRLSLSRELGFGLVGSDSVDFPGRANRSTERSISTGLCRGVREKTGRVAVLCVARAPSVPQLLKRPFCSGGVRAIGVAKGDVESTSELRDGISVMEVGLVEAVLRKEIASEELLVLQDSPSWKVVPVLDERSRIGGLSGI